MRGKRRVIATKSDTQPQVITTTYTHSQPLANRLAGQTAVQRCQMCTVGLGLGGWTHCSQGQAVFASHTSPQLPTELFASLSCLSVYSRSRALLACHLHPPRTITDVHQPHTNTHTHTHIHTQPALPTRNPNSRTHMPAGPTSTVPVGGHGCLLTMQQTSPGTMLQRTTRTCHLPLQLLRLQRRPGRMS